MIRDRTQEELLPLGRHPGDVLCERIITENRNMMIPWFLMACIAYERYDDPILTDGYFDRLSRRMAEEWDEIDHFHKHLIIMDDPETFKGSSTAIRAAEIPERLLQGTRHVIATIQKGS